MAEEEFSWVKAAVFAAAYATVTVLIAPIAFLATQVRVSDALLMLPFHRKFGKSVVVGVTIGGFFANLVSQLGVIDWIFGPIINLLVAGLAYLLGRVSRKSNLPELGRLGLLVVAAAIGTLIIASLVAYELMLVFELPYLIGFVGVAIGSAISLGIGVVLTYWVLRAIPEE